MIYVWYFPTDLLNTGNNRIFGVSDKYTLTVLFFL